MREEIAKILGKIARWDINDPKIPPTIKRYLLQSADAILALPVGNSTLGEMIELVPGIVEAWKELSSGNHISAEILMRQALTLKSGEILEGEG